MSDKFWKCVWWTCRHEIDGQKDEPCPYCRIAELEAENKRQRGALIKIREARGIFETNGLRRIARDALLKEGE